MRLLGCFLLLLGMTACSDEPKKEGAQTNTDGSTFSYGGFAEHFSKVSLPYTLADSSLLKQRDTTTLRYADFDALLPDSLRSKLFGAGKVRYSALGHLSGVGGADYFAVRALSGERKVALLYRFEKEKFTAIFPLLIPDADPATNQSSTVDRAGTLTRNISKKLPKEQVAEGKEVYVYNPDAKGFTLIGNDPLEDNQEVLNPIDTLGRKHALAGDYTKDARNFVSIRDARNPSEVNFFVHFETGEKDNLCVGELKGTALLTGSRTAIYRQGGDPCVLELNFEGNTVQLREMEGCGSRRGVQCVFEGTFTRKKIAPPKTVQKKKGKK
ncbi:MAG: hypothetical protein EOO15_12120 [Chitinophagaceae bacterium]|nr:MAG: hypothetical protein EOO15_12120 [Chitinophagaceae bacterium]